MQKKLITIIALVTVISMFVAASKNVIASPNAQSTAAATAAGTAAATKAATAAAPAGPTATLQSASADSSLKIPGMGMITGPMDGEASTLNGSGATFPLVVYLNWAKTYKDLTKVEINYSGGGSGKGRKDIIANAVDFAGSDAPMTDDEVKQAETANGPILHIPMVVGGVVPVYNIPEMKGQEIKFTGDDLAGIYMGDITSWNDPKLVADNPGLKDINKDIVVNYRSDSSGTTFNWTTFLAMSSDKFNTTVKAGSQVNFPVGTGSNGNPGVAAAVQQTPYSIGYVELAFAQSMKLDYGSVKNKAGNFVKASSDTMSKNAEGVTLPADLRIVIIGQSSDANAYPIAVFSWILVYQNQKDAAKATALARFLWWATHDGQKYNASLGYAPLPMNAIQADEQKILSINVNGTQSLPTSIATPSAAGTMAAPMMAATMAPTK